MTDLRKLSRKYQLILIVLLSIDLACAIILISPIGRSARRSQQELSALWAELQTKTRETLPLQGIDAKVVEAKAEINRFLGERLPPRFASVPDELGKLAKEQGVTLASAKYQTEETELPGVRRVVVQAVLSGRYGQQAKFINAVERDKLFFIIDSISLGEAQGGSVRLQIEMEAYIRSEATA